MTARPRRRRGAEAPPASGAFPPVEIAGPLLARVQEQTDAVAAADLVSGYLRTVHDPEPDHRDDRDRWLAWLEAVEHRPLEAALSGRLHDHREEAPRV